MNEQHPQRGACDRTRRAWLPFRNEVGLHPTATAFAKGAKERQNAEKGLDTVTPVTVGNHPGLGPPTAIL